MTDVVDRAAALREFDVSGISDDSLDLGNRSFQWAYWRMPDGEIIVAPAWPTEMVSRYEMGWEMLRQYGTFHYALNSNEQGGTWRPSIEPYRRIFARGGAHEFSLHEILSHGWHVKPPYAGIVFPQVRRTPDGDVIREDGTVHKDHLCLLCPTPMRRPFLTKEDLEKHQAIGHPQVSADNRTARAFAGAQEPLRDLLAELTRKNEESDARINASAEANTILQTQLATALAALAAAVGDLKGVKRG
jgi:hypothetical protein